MSVGSSTERGAMQTVRDRLAFHVRQHGFDRCMREIRSTERISTGVVAELFASWGDPLDASDETYLRSCMAELNAASGPVLLCGAGLNAVVFGAMCDRSENAEKQIWCLEHDRHWANVVRSWLTEYQISRAHVIHAPARLFDDYAWYSVDPDRLAKFQLIFCDGARATTRGIMGALKRIGPRLPAHFVMLARNVKEAGDLRFLNTWAKSHKSRFVLIDKQQGFIKLVRESEVEDLPLPEIQTGRQALLQSQQGSGVSARRQV